MDSFQWITYECIKDSSVGEKADIETFVITDGNRARTALYNQKLSSFNISCHVLPSHAVPSPPPAPNTISADTLPRLATTSILPISFLLIQSAAIRTVCSTALNKIHKINISVMNEKFTVIYNFLIIFCI